jgi:hypothetical protein
VSCLLFGLWTSKDSILRVELEMLHYGFVKVEHVTIPGGCMSINFPNLMSTLKPNTCVPVPQTFPDLKGDER